MLQKVIVITGLPLTGKTTIGEKIANSHWMLHIDDDAIRHTLFPHNRTLKGEDRRRVHQFATDTMLRAVELNLELGQSLVITSTLNKDEAKKRLLQLLQERKDEVQLRIFRLVLPEKVEEEVIRHRAFLRYGSTCETLLPQKIEHYNYIKGVATPWPGGTPVTNIDGSKSVDSVYRQILSLLEV